MSLSPLFDDDTARLVSALLDQALLPAELQAALLARAGGNPLYAEEYVRMLADRGYLRRIGGTWRLEHARELPLLESVQGIIAARLDALAPEDKALLQDAAVLGKVGWLGALAALSGSELFTLEQRLHALERREPLRRERRSQVAGERQYAFRHVLIRDVAYGQLPRAVRAGKHRRAGEWLGAAVARPRRGPLRAARPPLAGRARVRSGDRAGHHRVQRASAPGGARCRRLGAWAQRLRHRGTLVRSRTEHWPADDSSAWARLLLQLRRARFWAEEASEQELTQARDGCRPRRPRSRRSRGAAQPLGESAGAGGAGDGACPTGGGAPR